MKQALLKKKIILFGLFFSFLFSKTNAQTFQLQGKIIDSATQQAIPSATISSGKQKVLSDADGNFKINTEKGKDLTVSFIGYSNKTIPVNGNEFINVTLSQSSLQLSDIVVTATGIKKEAKRLGYSIQTIDASAFTKAREANPINALKGNVAGLTVNITPEIGHSPDVIMRGETGVLYVVDGVPISSDTYNINADDIESFSILKGPSAAALYGFQGQNGAIIINTKKGTKDKRGLQVTFNNSTQFNGGFIALPKYNDLYGPGDNGKYAFGGGGSSNASYFGSGAVGVGVNDYDYDVWGPQFRGQLLPQFDGEYDPNQTYTTTFADGSKYTGHVNPTPWTARGKDNLKNFLQTGLLQTNSISVSSSTQKTDFRISFGNTYQTGIVPNTKLNNGNFTTSLTERFNDKFSATAYFNYSRQSTPNIPDVNYGPNSIIYNIIIWGGADWSVNQPNIRNYWQPGKVGIQQDYAEYYRYNNPWFMSYEWLRGHYQNNAYGYLSLNYKLNKDIDFQFRPSMTAYDMTNSEKLPYSAGVYGRDLKQGDYREDRRSLFETNQEFQARYNHNSLFGFLDVSALAGANVRNFNFNSDFESTNYLNVPGIYSFSNSQGALTGSSFSSSLLVLSAYYSVDAGYKSYVTANVTGRVDKSSSLPSNTNSYYYPSFNLATVISEYANLPKVISFFKLRGSYAESKAGGTTPFFAPDVSATPAGDYGYTYYSPYGGPTYQFKQTYTQAPTYSGQSSAKYSDQLIDPSIITQDRKALEFGTDIRFFQNRIALDVTKYHYKNVGIVSKNIPQSTGYSTYLTNGNVYSNNGWEATLNAKILTNPKGLGWNVTVNYASYVRKWINYSNPDNYEHNGERVDLVYDNAFVRTDEGKMVIDAASGLYLRYSDLGVSAKKVYGHADPDFQWGIVNNFNYKNFSLRFQFDGMVGGVMEDYVRKKTLQGGRHIESAIGAFGAARPSDEANIAAYLGDGVNLTGAPITLDPITGVITNMKDLTETVNATKSQVQPFVTRMASIPDLDIIKKTYAKLREVTISYNLPADVIGNSSFIKAVSVSLVGRNLLYFFPDRYKDVDVDQYTQNSGSGLQTPTVRNYGFNVNVTF